MSVAPIADRPLPESPTGEPEVHAPAARVRAAPSSPFVQVMRALGHEAERGEALVRSVLQASGAGQAFGPTELIALQAGIYRYGETVDLAAKLVDKAGTDVKTVLQGQQ
jgi:hypothetical protein